MSYSSDIHVSQYYNREDAHNSSRQDIHTKNHFTITSSDYYQDVDNSKSYQPQGNQHDQDHSYMSSSTRDGSLNSSMDSHYDSIPYYRDQPGSIRGSQHIPRDYSSTSEYSNSNSDHQDASYSYRNLVATGSSSGARGGSGGFHPYQHNDGESDNILDQMSSQKHANAQSRYTNSGSTQSKNQFGASSSDYFNVESSLSAEAGSYGLGNRSTSMYSGSGGGGSSRGQHTDSGTGGGDDLDMSAYRRGLGMQGGGIAGSGSGGAGGESLDTYGNRYVPTYQNDREERGGGNSGGIGYYDHMDSDHMGSEHNSSSYSSTTASSAHTTFNHSTSAPSSGPRVSRYSGPSDAWMSDRPSSVNSGGRAIGRGGREGETLYGSAGRSLNFHNLQVEQQQQHLQQVQYDTAPSMKYHPRQNPRQLQGQHLVSHHQSSPQQHHIQQVHPRSSVSYGSSSSTGSGHSNNSAKSHNTGNSHYGGGGDQYQYQSPSQQQQVLSRYMDSGRGDDHSGYGSGGSIHSGSTGGSSKYMPRPAGPGNGPGYGVGGRGGGRGAGRGGGMNGRLGQMHLPQQVQGHYQHHQYGYGGSSIGSSGSSNGSYNSGYGVGKSHIDRGYDDDMSYDRSIGSGTNGGNGVLSTTKMLRGVTSNPNAAGRVALKTTSRSGDIVRDVELEEVIYRNTQIILSETANKRLKSVELANALRDRIGKDYLARTKTLYGGLLVLLELHRETFRVQRVPKNDMVELLIPYHGDAASSMNSNISSGNGADMTKGNNPDNEASNTNAVMPKLVPEAMGLDSTDIQKMQQARQLPGSGVVGWDMNSLPPASYSSSPSTSTPSQPETEAQGQTSKSPERKVIQPIQPSQCLYIREIPDDATASQIFADFGGTSIVEKVHINMEGTKRTGLIWFLTVSGALRALSIPLSSWRPFLSFHYETDEHTFEFVEEANAASVAELCAAMAAMSVMQRPDSDKSTSSGTTTSKFTSGNTTPNSSGGIAISPSFRNNMSPSYLLRQGQTVDVDMFNAFKTSNPNGNATTSSSTSHGLNTLVSPCDDSNILMWGNSKMKISGISSEKPPPSRSNSSAYVRQNSASSSSSSSTSFSSSSGKDVDQGDDIDSLPEGTPELTATTSLSERRLAPPPINTTFASDEQLLASRSPSSAISYQLTNSPNAACLSSPGTSEAFFAFQDDNAPGGLSILSKDNLPASMIEVMNTLCDVVYVPQKIWERNEVGDYPFIQVIVDILSVIFQNAFVQLTKLKQQVKKRLGGSIRIGPLKAILQAYPEHFEMDKNMTLVRSLKKELPLMNIDRVNLNLF